MHPLFPHVRLKYLVPLAIVTVFLTGTYLVWTTKYETRFLAPVVTLRPRVTYSTEKYSSSLSRGHDDERRTDIFGKLGRIKKQYLETEYQTKPPSTGQFITTDEEERMRRIFMKHRQMQKELDRKKEVFRHMKEEVVSTKSSLRDLKSKLHYHVERGATRPDNEAPGVFKSKSGGVVKLTYSKETRPDYCDRCMDIDIPYLINPRKLCSHNADRIQALVLIFSEPEHEKVRFAIRKTWGSLAMRNRGFVRIAFLFGKISDREASKAIRKESLEFGDILVGDFVDSFRNLTLKTIMGLNWAVKHCPSARYLAKTDDDMWLNLPKFFSVAKTLDLRNVITGTCYDEKWHPHRDSESKYYVSYAEYPNEDYPLLCTGTAYLMSMSVAEKIVRIQPNIPFFHLEDVYVALCRQRLGMGVWPLQGCFNYKENFDKCTYRNDVIASHWITPEEMHEAWDETCDGPDVIRDYLKISNREYLKISEKIR